ncbi:hypothetical protein AABB24_020257, partial [Solanum stoloniferum]
LKQFSVSSSSPTQISRLSSQLHQRWRVSDENQRTKEREADLLSSFSSYPLRLSSSLLFSLAPSLFLRAVATGTVLRPATTLSSQAKPSTPPDSSSNRRPIFSRRGHQQASITGSTPTTDQQSQQLRRRPLRAASNQQHLRPARAPSNQHPQKPPATASSDSGRYCSGQRTTAPAGDLRRIHKVFR